MLLHAGGGYDQGLGGGGGGARFWLVVVILIGPAYLLWMTGVEGRRLWIVVGLVSVGGCEQPLLSDEDLPPQPAITRDHRLVLGDLDRPGRRGYLDRTQQYLTHADLIHGRHHAPAELSALQAPQAAHPAA